MAKAVYLVDDVACLRINKHILAFEWLVGVYVKLVAKIKNAIFGALFLGIDKLPFGVVGSLLIVLLKTVRGDKSKLMTKACPCLTTMSQILFGMVLNVPI